MTATTFRIGGDLRVRRLGFGATHLPTERGAARENSLVVARRAVELGVTLIDTASMYGGGSNEELLVEALHPYPDGLHDARVGVADGVRGLRRTRRDHAVRRRVSRCRRCSSAGIRPARRPALAVGVPPVDRSGGGTTPERDRRPADRLLAGGLQVLPAPAVPVGPRLPAAALGRHLA
ncbi:aldo/keto reductase [Streptomyces sp. b94]|nr:aldo/keto reductase [Streptomyces sp. b94]